MTEAPVGTWPATETADAMRPKVKPKKGAMQSWIMNFTDHGAFSMQKYYEILVLDVLGNDSF